MLDLRQWNKKEVSSTLLKIKIGKTDIEKLFAFVTLEKYEDNRKELYKVRNISIIEI